MGCCEENNVIESAIIKESESCNKNIITNTVKNNGTEAKEDNGITNIETIVNVNKIIEEIDPNREVEENFLKNKNRNVDTEQNKNESFKLNEVNNLEFKVKSNEYIKNHSKTLMIGKQNIKEHQIYSKIIDGKNKAYEQNSGILEEHTEILEKNQNNHDSEDEKDFSDFENNEDSNKERTQNKNIDKKEESVDKQEIIKTKKEDADARSIENNLINGVYELSNLSKDSSGEKEIDI